MMRTITLSLVSLSFAPLFALTGGPDQYGYMWKDSDEPDGPVFDWIDITGTGTQIFGLADDNFVGPFVMGNNFPFYWYDVKKIWFGSNGYISFQPGNIAAQFPGIPDATGTNDYIAAFMTDLNFQGVGNPAQCWVDDNLERVIVSYINVPFWTPTDPLYTGATTFQFILSKVDSTITIQYQGSNGFTSSNGPLMGIESVLGDIGLQQGVGTYPPAGYAVRYYNPPDPLLDIWDASILWVTDESNGGHSLAMSNSIFPLHAFVQNTGNQDVQDFTTTVQVVDPNNNPVAIDAQNVGLLVPGQSADIVFDNTFAPSSPGTYTYTATISGIANEVFTSNNQQVQELVVYDTSQTALILDWAGATDDGIGIGWNGGDGGVGAHIMPPFYPCHVTHTTVRIMSNFGLAGFYMKVFDDDGVNYGPGTLLDSVFVDPVQATVGDHMFPLNTPFQLDSGGVYVEWYMAGANINIAQDIVPPFSLRSYEVIQGVWAEYRDRETADFHLGLRVTHQPNYDIGCSSLSGLTNGQNIYTNVNVAAYIHNFGNQFITNVPMSYSFNGGPQVDQTYTGPLIPPGDSALFTFAQQLQPSQTVSAPLCVWTTGAGDLQPLNDTTCVMLDMFTGIAENTGAAMHIAPNPARDRIRISGLGSGPVGLEVFDMTGAMVRTERVAASSGSIDLSVTELTDGAYVIRATAKSGVFVARFVVQR